MLYLAPLGSIVLLPLALALATLLSGRVMRFALISGIAALFIPRGTIIHYCSFLLSQSPLQLPGDTGALRITYILVLWQSLHLQTASAALFYSRYRDPVRSDLTMAENGRAPLLPLFRYGTAPALLSLLLLQFACLADGSIALYFYGIGGYHLFSAHTAAFTLFMRSEGAAFTALMMMTGAALAVFFAAAYLLYRISRKIYFSFEQAEMPLPGYAGGFLRQFGTISGDILCAAIMCAPLIAALAGFSLQLLQRDFSAGEWFLPGLLPLIRSELTLTAFATLPIFFIPPAAWWFSKKMSAETLLFILAVSILLLQPASTLFFYKVAGDTYIGSPLFSGEHLYQFIKVIPLLFLGGLCAVPITRRFRSAPDEASSAADYLYIFRPLFQPALCGIFFLTFAWVLFDMSWQLIPLQSGLKPTRLLGELFMRLPELDFAGELSLLACMVLPPVFAGAGIHLISRNVE